MQIVGGSGADDQFGASTFLSSRPDEESHEIVLFANAAFRHTAFRVATLADLRARYSDAVEARPDQSKWRSITACRWPSTSTIPRAT